MVPTLTEKMGTGGNNVPMVMGPMSIHQNQLGELRLGKAANTLNTNSNATGRNSPIIMEPAVAFDCRNLAPNIEVSATPQAKNNGGQSLNYVNPVFQPTGASFGINRQMFNCGSSSKIGFKPDEEISPTLVKAGPGAVIYPATAPEISGTLTAKMAKGTGGPAGDEMQNLVAEWPEYIVRRFTPLECCRLQGFPDWWTVELGTPEPTLGMIDRWMEIFKVHWQLVTSKDGVKNPKTRNQVIKWLKDPTSDSALYKLWGNGIALPCAMFVMEGIATYNRTER